MLRRRADDTVIPLWAPARLISVLGIVSIFVLLANEPDKTVAASALMVHSAGYLVGLSLAIAILTVRRSLTLRRMDLGILVFGAVLFVLDNLSFFSPAYHLHDDEWTLGSAALRALLHGQNPYTVSFPDVARLGGITPLLGGGAVTRYEYPPLDLELGWVLHHVWAPLGAPQVLALLGVLATALVVTLALPGEYRVLAVPFTVGLDLFANFAASSMPAMLALPLMCVVAFRWTSIGTGGRLGIGGVGRAVALGAAASAQQLSWLIAVFVLVAVWRVRRGELSRARAALVMLRFGAIAAAVFVALNAPLAVQDPHAWAVAMMSVFTQHAIPSGVGVVAVSVVALAHSGALQYYSYATVLFLLALTGLVATGIRRVGPAVPLLGSALFLFSSRSTRDYFEIFIPMWLVWAATADEGAIDRAMPLTLPVPEWLRGRGAVLAVLAFVPSTAVALAAVVASPPLTMRVTNATLSISRMDTITLQVTNRTDQAVRPSFGFAQRANITVLWHVIKGPSVVPPRRTVSISVSPDNGPFGVVPHLIAYALAPDPASISSTPLRLTGNQVTLLSHPKRLQNQHTQRCALSMLAGSSGACLKQAPVLYQPPAPKSTKGPTGG